ncbi:MAG: hypothetical protein IPN95_08240 [Bacteroidetes bacterium]|nr:hypothetical protein [Bacteroidota bacterium]MBP8074279.1 hypothetical protein [Bacteroidia bacterium]
MADSGQSFALTKDKLQSVFFFPMALFAIFGLNEKYLPIFLHRFVSCYCLHEIALDFRPSPKGAACLMENQKSYSYVGPKDLLSLVKDENRGHRINDLNKLAVWMENNRQMIEYGRLTATFVINEDQELVIADRHSEHVACAGGKNVLAAGEITFSLDGENIEVIGITNQSTGYCPKVDSWSIVHKVLDAMVIQHPDYFTYAFEFRRCDDCGNTNLVKDGDFTCAICEASLDEAWNY